MSSSDVLQESSELNLSDNKNNDDDDVEEEDQKSILRYGMGALVYAKPINSNVWKLGQIVGINVDGTYDVSYDDGKESLDLDPMYISRQQPINLIDTNNSNTEDQSKSISTLHNQSIPLGNTHIIIIIYFARIYIKRVLLSI